MSRDRSVSVIIPNYNHARFLPLAVSSALDQTLRPIEVIVVDDGSTDGSRRALEPFSDRIRVIARDNGGVSEARNQGARRARGRYLAFLDADDLWLPSKLEGQVARFEADPRLGLVHCGTEMIDAHGTRLGRILDGMDGWVAEAMLQFRRPVILGGGSGAMIPRPIFEAAGGFDVRLSTSADWDLYYRIACRWRVGFVPDVLLHYRLHGANMHGDVARMEHDMLLAYHKAFQDAPASLRARRRCSFGRLHTVLAGSYYGAGHYAHFARHAVLGMLLAPGDVGQYLTYPWRRWRRKQTHDEAARSTGALGKRVGAGDSEAPGPLRARS